MDEGKSVPFKLLHNEAFTAEEARAQLALEFNPDRDALGCTEKRILLADDFAAVLLKIQGNDFTRIRGGKGYTFTAVGSAVREDCHEQAFTGQQAFARAHQLAHQPASA
ncbi:hypothetical protein D3C74_386930 [compost metagenome]